MKEQYIPNNPLTWTLTGPKVQTDHSIHILDMREYDVPYNVRSNIDKNLFVAHWYVLDIVA